MSGIATQLLFVICSFLFIHYLMKSKLPAVGTTIFTVMSGLANEYKAINLSQGFPNFECSPRLQQLIYDYMQKGYNQYAPMAGVPILRERLAQKINTIYGSNVSPDHITVTAGGTQALFTAITAFVHAGDEVIIIEPAYDSYRPAVMLAGGVPRIYELSAPDFTIDWEQFGRLVTSKTRMIMINTPHNPTGKTWSAADLRALEKLVRGKDIIVLSDEVYEHLIFDGRQHESILRYPSLWEQSMAVYSFGKTFHATGWKMGYVVAAPALMREFQKVHQFNVFSVNTPMQYAIADFLDNEDEYLSLPHFYQQKRDFLLDVMSDVPLQPLACEGTYFQLYSYAHLSDAPDLDFAKHLTKTVGVAVIPVSAFYANQKDEKLIRICFAKTNETLEKAAVALRKLV
jgi:methionine transaminase